MLYLPKPLPLGNPIVLALVGLLWFGKLFAQPTITSFSPVAAPSGSLVTITGTNFNSTLANNEVFFGGIKANIVSVSSTTQLVAVVPVAASGDAFITVRNTATRLQARSLRRFAQTYSGGSTTTSTQFPTASKSTVLAPSQSNNPVGGDTRINSQMICIGDFNADGFLDYAAWGGAGTDVRIYINNGASGAISSSKFSTTYTYAVAGIQGIHDSPVDMNGDGRLDVVCFSSSGVSILVNNLTNATPSFTKSDVSIASGFYRVAVDDFNKDGRLDIAGTTSRWTKNIRILQNTSTNGSLSFSGTLTTITTAKNAVDLHSGDFDNDGDIDLLYTNYDSYWNILAFELRYIKNNTPSTWSFGNETQLWCCLNEGEFAEFPIVNSDDLDGDGDLDIVTLASANSTATNNVATFFRNDGNWSFSGTSMNTYTPKTNYAQDLEFSDINGDGKIDIVLSTDVMTAELVVFYNQFVSGGSAMNSQSFSSGSMFPVNSSTDAAYTLGLGDMNADGKIDLISNTLFTNNMITWASGAVSSAVATVSASTLSGFSSCSNGVSTAQSFTVSATGLGTDNLIITAPTGFEVSKSLASGYASSISFAPSGGNVATSTVYVRQNQATIGTTSGAVFITANTAGLKSVVVSGSVTGAPTLTGTTTVVKTNTVVLTGSGTPHSSTPWTNSNAAIATITPSGTTATVLGVSGGTTSVTYMDQTGCSASVTVTVLDPTITVNNSSLTGLSRCTTGGNASAAYGSIIINGTSLSGDVTVSVSSSFELSYSPNPNIAQFSTITFTPSSGVVSNQYVYVRLKSGVTGAATGTITLTTPNGNTVAVTLSGNMQTGVPVLTTSNATRCGSGTVTLSGSATNDGTLTWYSTSSGTTVLGTGNSYTTSSMTGSTGGQVTTVYPSATNTCGTTSRNTVTATVYNTTVPTASSQTFCAGATVANLVATGTNIKWYTASSGGSALSTSTALVQGTYFATQTSAANCESTNRTSVTVTVNAAAPVLTLANNSRCGSGSVSLTASATNMSAHQIRWYTVASSGTAISTGITATTVGTSALAVSFVTNEVGTSKTYYVEAQNACGTTTRDMVLAYSNTSTPVLTLTSGLRCGAGSVDLTASATNMSAHQIRWYTVSSGGTALTSGVSTPSLGSSLLSASFATNELGTTKSYYVEAQNACGTTSRSLVTAVCDAADPVLTLSAANRCGAGNVPMTATATNMSAHQIRWYTVSSGGSVLSSGIATPSVGSSVLTIPFASNELGTTKTYYAEAQNACNTTARIGYSVTADAGLPVLTVSSDQRCGTGDVELVSTSTNLTLGLIRWYTVSSGGTPLSSGISSASLGSSTLTVSFASNELGTSKTYYSEAQNACGTTARSSSVAKAFAIPSNPTVTSAVRCGSGALTLSSSTQNGMLVRWYSSNGSTLLDTGATWSTPTLSASASYLSQLWNRSALQSGLSCTSSSIPVDATIQTSATWNGTGTWDDPSKWDCGGSTYPSGTENLVLASGVLTLNNDISLSASKTFGIASGATLLVAPNYALTIGDGSTLTNAGTITLDADATGYGQLLLNGTYTTSGSGVVVTKRLYDVSTAPVNAKWTQFSAPVYAPVSQLGNVQPNNLFTWDAQNNEFDSVSSTHFQAGKGYTAYYGPNGVSTTQTGTLQLSGTPFTTVAIPTIKYSSFINWNVQFAGSEKRGWNLIGNPLTSNLDFGAFTRNNLDGAFYRWDPNKGGPGQPGYHDHAQASVTNDNVIIPPMTAVWVRAKSAVGPGLGNGNITPATHGHRNGSKSFSQKTAPDKFLISVSELANALLGDHLSLAMVPGASDAFEGDWDAWELLNGGTMPNVFADFNSEWTTAKAIDFGLDATAVKVVPVGVISPQEMQPYRFHLNADLAHEEYTVYLRDKLLNSVHKLSTSDYVFAYTSAMEDRFELILTNAKTGALGLEEASRGALTAWVNGSELWITSLEAGAQQMDVVGMDGRVVAEQVVRAEEGQPSTVTIPELPAGLYTVRVRSNGLERGVRFAVQR